MIKLKALNHNSIIIGVLTNVVMTIVFIVFIILGHRSTSENAAIQDDTFRTHFQSRLILKSINGLNHSRADILLALKDHSSDYLTEAEDQALGAKSNYHLLMSEQTLNGGHISNAFEDQFSELQLLYNKAFSATDPFKNQAPLLALIDKTTTLVSQMYDEESALWVDEALKLHEFSKIKERNQYIFYGLTVCFIFVEMMFIYFTILRHRLNKKINLQHERLVLQTRLSTLGMMSAELAHEINTPLMVIDGRLRILYNELISTRNTNEKLHKNLEIIKRNSRRIQDIIKSFKTMSKSGDNDPFELVHLSVIFDEVKDLAGPKLSEERIDFNLGEVTSDFYIEARRIQVVQVLTNLINNSMDAIKGTPHPWIKIQSEIKDNERIVICVTDSGPGIDEDQAMNIFDPFYSTKGSSEGTGLGLSISKKIMKEHGGDLSYNPEAEHTQFVLSFRYKKAHS